MGLDHVGKRRTRAGRWLPAAFFALNILLWVITALAAGAGTFLWLALLPLIALAAYLARTRQHT